MAFSPDGEWLVLLDHRGLRRVSIHGGAAQLIAPLEDDDGSGLSWGPDGSILVGHSSGLLRVPSSAGRAEPLTRVAAAAGETGHIYPSHLPGGTHALMTIARGDEMQLSVVDLARGSYQALPVAGSQAVYSNVGPHRLPAGRVRARRSLRPERAERGRRGGSGAGERPRRPVSRPRRT